MNSSGPDVRTVRFGDVTYESTDRLGTNSDRVTVFGVDRQVGLTLEPRYQSKDLARYKLVKPGMFVYNPMRLNIGSIGFCREELGAGVTSPDYVVFGCKTDQLNPVFLRYHTQTAPWANAVALSGEGSVRERIYYRKLANYTMALPSIEYQDKAVAALGALDDKIELNRKMNATLEAMARALFRDWFVDFGPTRAKMEGRAPYLSPDLWSLFPDRLDAEGKPEGWETGTLNDIATLNPESWTARNAPERVAYVDLANTKWGNIDQVEDYAWAEAPSRARRILRAGDSIVGTVRPGNGSFCYVGEHGLTGSTGFAVLRPQSPRDNAFVWCAATSPENIDRLAHMADGGAYPAVRPDAVTATEIVIPGADVLEAFREAVSANIDLMEANKVESRTLAQARDLLLPRLMSGELRVADAEPIVEAAQ